MKISAYALVKSDLSLSGCSWIYHIRHETFILGCPFLQWHLQIGSASAERAGRRKWVGAPEGCRQHSHLWAQLEKCFGWLWVGNYTVLLCTNRLRK